MIDRGRISVAPPLGTRTDDAPYEYTEVDFYTPTKLQIEMNDFPLASESIEINRAERYKHDKYQ